jgi:hypothetical protein
VILPKCYRNIDELTYNNHVILIQHMSC